MSTRSQRSAMIHSVSFQSSLPAGFGRVYVSYPHHPEWSRVFASIDDASYHLGIGRNEIAKASNTFAQLLTIVPIIDAETLITPSDLGSSQQQPQPCSSVPLNSFEMNLPPACLYGTNQTLRESPQMAQSAASIEVIFAQPKPKRSHHRRKSRDTPRSLKPNSQQAFTEANSRRARRLWVHRVDRRPGYKLRLPEGATQESEDGLFLSFASIGDATEYVCEHPVDRDGSRTCKLEGKENKESFIVVMSHDKASCEQAVADMAGTDMAGINKRFSVRHPEKALWFKDGPRPLRPGYIVGEITADE